MANWQRQLDIKAEWRDADEKRITVQQLAKIIAKKLQTLKLFDDYDIDSAKDDLVEQFEAIAEDSIANTNDFDNVMNDLYDWADIKISGGFFDAKKVCWIKTNF